MNAKQQQAAELFAAAIRSNHEGRLEEAQDFCRQVCAIDSTHVAALHLLGVLSHRIGRLEAAELIERALELKPDFAEAHNDLGVVLGSRGKLTEAVAHFERAVHLNPDYAEAHNNLGNALRELGKLDAAVRHLKRAVVLKPRDERAYLNLGNTLKQEGKLDEAVAQYASAVQINPKSGGAHYNLAIVMRELGRTKDAAISYRRAVALMPNFADAHNNLGNTLHQLGQLDEALVCCQRAVALRPDFSGAHNNLANILRELGRLDEAVAHYKKALAINPNLAMAHYNLAIVLRRQGHFTEARACFESALRIRPESFEAGLALCMAQLPVLYKDEAEIANCRTEYEKHLILLQKEVERARTLRGLATALGSQQPFYLAYQGRNDRQLQALYGSLVCRIMAEQFPTAPSIQRTESAEPLKVGIASGFFRQHSNWKIPIKGWLAQLDRRRFRVFGYHTGLEQDRETEVAAGLCERFVRGPLTLQHWSQTIAEDRLDVIIYPEVGMDPTSAQLAAQRLAVVQCTSWGHPDTSGFPTLDYYLSSDLMEPEDGDQHYTEQLIRLPNLSIYYEPMQFSPAGLDRAAFGLRSSATSYWCSQSLSKYLPQYDHIFPRIACEAGDCQFVFIEFPGAPHITQMFKDRLERAFAAFGMRAAEYCIFLPRLEADRFHAAMGQCDIFLDSIGWSGCNSTMESLDHDLPIVTMPSDLMRSRHTSAILKMMGIVDMTTNSLDHYVSLAARLARDHSLRDGFKYRISKNKHHVYRDKRCIAALEDFLQQAVYARTTTADGLP